MTETCHIDTCNNQAIFIYGNTHWCGECWELFAFDRADEQDEKDKVKDDTR